MAVAKKDQERVTYAWMYGQQARKDGKERSVPDYWNEYAEAWLQGFDGLPLGSEPKSVSDQLEAELDDSAVSKPE
ncbi:MAG: hypothetical protein EOS76_11780 [Mesorhizobium sp.]|uniref:hypothetical protein n=1 Tax=unclassified Mesorhizobium TaxID=325217 RepID=UPI000F74DE74|nr:MULTISPECIES: hypothetical protein [unclassified Mesorhizobium]AZO35485.1 hypothetical protein EJ072_14160 [Mesorhizobium sp. M2A.F.Ca.ET.046.03.2.1]RVC78069.1 hypothetical protein EN766_10170 [Mesorhizobium sp. M2A.F.Ca.ET.046.02.1.1]RWB45851.1 MAG: hypothetical protein EOQ44_10720 [Mesorhizobium sp.]RWE19476.1 MAG: hypothetical protein EOS76_11780 [Mesorhizobium sp.]